MIEVPDSVILLLLNVLDDTSDLLVRISTSSDTDPFLEEIRSQWKTLKSAKHELEERAKTKKAT